MEMDCSILSKAISNEKVDVIADLCSQLRPREGAIDEYTFAEAVAYWIQKTMMYFDLEIDKSSCCSAKDGSVGKQLK